MPKQEILFSLGKGIKADPGILKSITEKYLKSSDLKVSSRILNYWKKQDILLEKYDEKKHDHLRFSFLDYVWFSIIREMRDYGLSLELIKNIKNELITSIPISYFLEIGLLEYLVQTLPENEKESFLEIIHDPKFQKEIKNELQNKLDADEIKFNLLNIFVTSAIISRMHVAIIINKKGEVYSYSLDHFDEFMNDRDCKNSFLSSHISISISSIIKEYLIDPKFDLSSDKLFLLSSREAQIIELLRKEKLSSLTVYLDDEKNIKLIETTKKYNKIDAESRLLDFIIKDGYQTIELKTQAGKIVYCSNIKKIKPIKDKSTE